MAPEINMAGIQINVPDKTGTYQTELGEVTVDMSGIDPSNRVQILRLEGGAIGQTREVHLGADGIGSQQLGPEQYLVSFTVLFEGLLLEGLNDLG